MFEKIGRYAETVATSAGQSRRGFLGLLGKGALSLAGLVGGILLVPGKAAGFTCSGDGKCTYQCPPNHPLVDVPCSKACTCPETVTHSGVTCFLQFQNCHFVF
jgi:hypothetical protein